MERSIHVPFQCSVQGRQLRKAVALHSIQNSYETVGKGTRMADLIQALDVVETMSTGMMAEEYGGRVARALGFNISITALLSLR